MDRDSAPSVSFPAADPPVIVVPPQPHSGREGLAHKIRVFFGPSPCSLKGFTDLTEKLRSGLLSFVMGGVVHVIVSVLSFYLVHIASVFPNPLVAGMATVIITYIIDALRRSQDGAAIVVVPSPTDPSSDASRSLAA